VAERFDEGAFFEDALGAFFAAVRVAASDGPAPKTQAISGTISNLLSCNFRFYHRRDAQTFQLPT
jgi:hypothetical protein